MPGVENAKPYRLAEQIEILAKAIRRLSESLNGAADDLETLLANRPAHRPPRPGSEYYEALKDYRMGRNLEDISTNRLGVKPWDGVEGTKSWKTNLREKIARGKEVEDKRYPRAAAIFNNEDDPSVQHKALEAYKAYQDYLVECEEDEAVFDHHFALWAVGRRISANPLAHPGQEIIDAYIQLGYRIKYGRAPLP